MWVEEEFRPKMFNIYHLICGKTSNILQLMQMSGNGRKIQLPPRDEYSTSIFLRQY